MQQLEGVPLPPVMQVGFGVRDAEASAAVYSQIFGLGPFEFQEAVMDGDYRYRGKPSFCRLKIATCQSGQVQIELIELLEGEHPSASYLEEHGEGINHLAFEVEDLDAMLAQLDARGVPLLIRGTVTLEDGRGVRYAYVDARKPGVPMLEFVEYF